MRPDQVATAQIGHDPNSSILASNAAELAALHGAGAGADLSFAPPTSGAWPAGLAPAMPAENGMPPHLGGVAPGAVPTLSPEQIAALNMLPGPGAPVAPLAATTAVPVATATVPIAVPPVVEAGLHASASPADPEPEPQHEPERQAVIYNTQGLNLSTKADDDGLVWKVACKTGTLALSPGPGQMDLDKPLELTGDLFDDMLLSFQEKAFPYVTVPETHANGVLENTGFVRKAEALDRDELLADQRFAGVREEIREMIASDPEDTRYLLAGIEFTEPEVKEKAERGTIPDVSIGVKFNFRNKRSGKNYKAAWEHLALTPMPWIDGLIPFGLSQDGKVFDREVMDMPYDGVYVPVDMQLSTETRQRGAFDAVAAKTQIMAMSAGDEWSWDWDVRVQAIQDDEDGMVWLLQGGYVSGPGYEPPSPQIFRNIDSLVGTVATRVAECIVRRERDRLGHAHYAQEPEGEGLDLAVVTFDPSEHPRDFKGRFRKVLNGLKIGDSVTLPNGTKVFKTLSGHGHGPGKTELVVVGKDGDKTNPELVEEDVAKAADAALDLEPNVSIKNNYVAPRQIASGSVDEDALGQLIQGLPDGTNLEYGDLSIRKNDVGNVTVHGKDGKKLGEGYHGPGEENAKAAARQALAAERVANKREKSFKAGDIVAVSGLGLARYVGPAGKAKPDNHLVERMVARPGGKSRKITSSHTAYELTPFDGDPSGAGSLRGLDGPEAPPAGTRVNVDGYSGTVESVEGREIEVRLDNDQGMTYLDLEDEYTVIERESEAQIVNAVEQLKPGDSHRLASGARIKLSDDGYSLIASDGSVEAEGFDKAAVVRLARELHLSQEDGTSVSDEDLLALVEDDGLPAELQASQETETEMPTTAAPNASVEALLASQQADLEASEQRIAEMQARLDRADALLMSQGGTLHVNEVNEKVRKLQASGLPPVLCLSAREIYLADNPVARAAAGTEDGLNLSVQAPKPGAENGEVEERKLRTPSDIVDHLLASVPRGEVDAAHIAATLHGLDDLHLSVHDDKNPEADAKKAVDDFERQRHPERFDEEGKRI
jgi:hypothetical protein